MKVKVLSSNSKVKPERSFCRNWQVEYHRKTMKILARASGKTRWFEQDQSEKKTLRNLKTPRDSVNLLLRKICNTDLDGVATNRNGHLLKLRKRTNDAPEERKMLCCGRFFSTSYLRLFELMTKKTCEIVLQRCR